MPAAPAVLVDGLSSVAPQAPRSIDATTVPPNVNAVNFMNLLLTLFIAKISSV